MHGAIPYSINHAQLHTDVSVPPQRRRARASWNYLIAPDREEVLVTYDISRLNNDFTPFARLNAAAAGELKI